MNRIFAWALLFLFAAAPLVRADGPDDAYVGVYGLIQQADEFYDKGQSAPAMAKYLEAQSALKKFSTSYPDWNLTIIKYRGKYVAEKIAELTKGAPAPAPIVPAVPATTGTGTPAAPTTPPAAVVPEPPAQSLQDQLARLSAEKVLLEAKLKEALAAQPAAVDPRELEKAQAAVVQLQKEKELLQVSLDAAKAASTAAPGVVTTGAGKNNNSNGTKPNRQAAEAQAKLDALQTERDMLRVKNAALESQIKQVSAGAAPVAPAVTAVVPMTDVTGAERIKGADLQIATLRARIEALESPRVPYTAEELALFKGSEAKLAAATPTPKKPKPLPPGAATIMAEANRYFVGHQYDKAEEKYLELLKMDDQNVGTLGNLALIQLELNHLEDAEKHLQQGLAVDPNDSFSLGVLGRVKFQQGKYEEAQDTLSRAAQLDPKNAEVQNYLGITLDHPGLRGPAETALRKAIQIAPEYGAAHNNLAVVYITQKPPLVELSRWHYQKARAAGHPVNPELERMIDAATAKPADAAK